MEDLVSIQDWFNVNKLTLNLSKIVYLYFEKNARSDTDLDLSLNGVTIPRMKCTKFLGVWVDDQLNWKQHVAKLITRLNSRTGLLYRGKFLLSPHAKKILYYGQVHSLITYRLSIWGALARASMLNRIQKIQNNCLQCIEPRLSTKECSKKHKILSIKDLIKLEQSKLGFKVCKGLLPNKLQNCLTTDSRNNSLIKTHMYNTRHKIIPNVPKMHTSMYKNSFMHACIKEYSIMSNKITGNVTLKTFTNRCKAIYLKN